jgi:hypothetical protein
MCRGHLGQNIPTDIYRISGNFYRLSYIITHYGSIIQFAILKIERAIRKGRYTTGLDSYPDIFMLDGAPGGMLTIMVKL